MEMATGESNTVKSLWSGLFQAGLYKRTQGRVARQLTFAVLLGTIVIGIWRMIRTGLLPFAPGTQYMIAGALLLASGWVCFRVVNYPRFADFLIAVEAEMAKVSWPSRGEITRSASVVMITIFGLAALLYVYDVILIEVFQLIGIRR
jgi:preprotein translocase subunit SecE